MPEGQPQAPEVRRPAFHRPISIADNSSQADIVVSPLSRGLIWSITLPDVLEKLEDDLADGTPEPSSVHVGTP